MRRQSRPLRSREEPRSCTTSPLWLGLAACALAAAGCEEEVRNVGNRHQTRALDQTGVSVGLDTDRPQAPAPPRAPAKREFIVGKRTQEIRNATTELQKGGAQVATTKITAKDPITLPGNAYVTIIGRTSMMNIEHALDLYQAESGH